jgi:crossover junction endodeoxyribonuclease RusA
MTTTILTLPFPPSINTYWGFHGHRRFLTKKALQFKAEVLAVILTTNTKSYGDDLLAMNIVWFPPDRRIRDIDNPIKPLLDSLVQANVMNDDSQIRQLTLQFGEICKGGKALVTITNISK